MLYQINYIKDKLSSILISKGIKMGDALKTSSILIEGDLRGYPSHGINRIFQILEGLNNKVLSTKDNSTVVKDQKAIFIIDGKEYLGQPLAERAMIKAIENSKIYGVGVSGVINSSHIGILSYYSELAAMKNCIGIVISTSSPAVSLPGASIKTFGTNPISYALPANIQPCILSDFSTSKVSRGKIYEYLEENKTLPDDWAVDGNGNPTNCPVEALKGGLQTLDAGIKGSSISMLISVLAGPLIGGVINPKVTGTRYMNEKPNKGDFFIALDVASFCSLNEFKNNMDELIKFLNHQQSNFRVPGSNSFKRKKENMLSGLPLSAEILSLFNEHGEEF